tara:strand:+ start:691 stop:813 length:123 start_codon:yes stop_codon:yes gene_type:complete
MKHVSWEDILGDDQKSIKDLTKKGIRITFFYFELTRMMSG